LKETEDILCGKINGVQFFLEDQKFYWKRKIWYLGQINIKSINGLDYVKDFTMLLIDKYSQLKNSVFRLQQDNDNLKDTNSSLLKQLDELVVLKDQLERKLYKKFILLINTKKAKIRELQSKLEKLENKDSIYNAVTDESNESDSQNDFTSHSKIIEKLGNKRLINEDSNGKINVKRQKFEEILENKVIANKSKIQSINENIKSIVSKSKTFRTSNLREDEETPDLLSDESECEVELKFEEENIEDESKNKIGTTIQEDSEEEMF
jgi:hypothetical protein